MNQEVPQPTTATRSSLRGSPWDRAATATARRQQSGCELSSAWMNGSRSTPGYLSVPLVRPAWTCR